jgi:hypothetical protein
MARPKKDAPRPDTVLVTFRLARSLVAALDGHAAEMPVTGDGLPTRSDAARDLMQRGLGITAIGKPTPPSASSSDSRVLAAGQALATGPGGTVRLADLREHLHDMRRGDLDKALFRLEAARSLSFGRAVELAAVTPADRDAAIHDAVCGMLIYACFTNNRNTVSASRLQ